MKIVNNWTGTVVEQDGELWLVFEKELMDELRWQEGDNIVWDMDDDKKVVVVKKEINTGPTE